ncbi:MAG TPA: diguanylate cyclase [Rhodoferax sp.]
MNTLQALGLCAIPVLLWLYWRERSKLRETTAVMNRALKDVTDRLEHDDRTGLLTFDKFEARLEEEVQRADQTASSLSVLAVSIDNFGLISNGFGETSAADVVKLAAERLVAAPMTMRQSAKSPRQNMRCWSAVAPTPVPCEPSASSQRSPKLLQ